MSSEDPEIKIKVNAEQGDGPAPLEDLVQRLQEVKENAEAAREPLQETSREVGELAARAAELKENAAATDNPFVSAAAESTLTMVTGAINNLTRAAERLGKGFAATSKEAEAMMEGLRAGTVSAEEAEAALGSMEGAVAAGERAMQQMGEMAQGVQETFAQTSGLEKMLSCYGEFVAGMDEAAGYAQAMKSVLQEQAASYGEQVAALDKTSKGYERQKEALLAARAECQQYVAQIETLTSKLDGMSQSVDAAVDGFDKNGGISKAVEAIAEQQAQLESFGAKLEEINGRMEQSAAKRAAAMEDAARREAAAEEKNTYATQLAAKSKRELIDETKRLIAARQEAAAVGDVEAYQALTEQLRQCRTAMRDLAQQRTLERMSTVQQAQASMQFAQGLKSLVEQARSGSTDFASMATQVLALGTAFKAAMGPIGWVMLALQGAQMAFEYFANKRKEEIEEELKAFDRIKESIEEVNKAMEEAEALELEIKTEGIKEKIREVQEAAHAAAEDMRAKNQEVEEASRRALQEEMVRQKEAYELTDKRIELELKLGKISAEEATKRRAEAKERYEEEKRRLEIGDLELEVTIATDRLEEAKAELEAMSESVANTLVEELKDGMATLPDMTEEAVSALSAEKVQELLQIKLPDLRVLDALNRELNATIKLAENAYSDAQRADYEKRARELSEKQEALESQFDAIKELCKSLGVAVGDGYEGTVKFVRAIQGAAEATNKLINRQRDTVAQAEKGVEAARANVNEARKRHEHEREMNAITNRAREAEYEAERRKLQWVEQQQKPLAEQMTWLKKTLGCLQEGSAEWQQWYNTSAQLARGAISELAGKYKTLGSYAESQVRTQSEIQKLDRETLAAKQGELRALIEMAQGLHPQLAAAFSKELEAVTAQAKLLEENINKNAREAAQWAHDLKPPELQARYKSLQKSLDGAARQYTYLTKKAAEAAKRGDLKKLREIEKRMQPFLRAMDRLGEHGNEGAKAWEETKEQINQIYQGTRRSKEAAKRHAAESEKAAKKQGEVATANQEAANDAKQGRKASQKAARATERTAEAAQKEAEAAKEGAEARQEDAEAAKNKAEQTEQQAQEASARMAELSGSIVAVQGAMAQLAEKHAELAANVQSMAGQITALVAAAGQVADAAATGATAAATGISELKTQAAALRKAIDLIQRKS